MRTISINAKINHMTLAKHFPMTWPRTYVVVAHTVSMGWRQRAYETVSNWRLLMPNWPQINK